MHRDTPDQVSTMNRFAFVPPGSPEPLRLDAQIDADPLAHDADPTPRLDRNRPAASLLTPAVQRVLAWHQRRGS
jgi:hypothetical protein